MRIVASLGSHSQRRERVGMNNVTGVILVHCKRWNPSNNFYRNPYVKRADMKCIHHMWCIAIDVHNIYKLEHTIGCDNKDFKTNGDNVWLSCLRNEANILYQLSESESNWSKNRALQSAYATWPRAKKARLPTYNTVQRQTLKHASNVKVRHLCVRQLCPVGLMVLRHQKVTQIQMLWAMWHIRMGKSVKM